MCLTFSWRDLLEKKNPALICHEITPDERKAGLTDPILFDLIEKAKPEDDAHRKTWLFPADPLDPEGLHHMVLGWNSVAVFVPVSQGFWLDFVLSYHPTQKQFPVISSSSIPMEIVEEYPHWTFFRPVGIRPLGKVVTYNATSCSVSVLRERGGTGPVVFAHLDGTPPIPFGLLGEIWHANGSGGHFQGITSVCPYPEDLEKFTDQACFAGGRIFPLELNLLARGLPGSSPGSPMENHTEFFLDLAPGHLPYFQAFLGFKERQFHLLFPLELKVVVEELALAAIKAVGNKSQLEILDGETKDRVFKPLMLGEYGNTALFFDLFGKLLEVIPSSDFPQIECLKVLHAHLADPSCYSEVFMAAMRGYQKKINMGLGPENFGYLRQ